MNDEKDVMRTATEALRLPTAQLKPTDMDGIKAVLAYLDAQLDVKMMRRGAILTVPVNGGIPLNDVIIGEVTRELVKRGWLVNMTATGEVSQITRQPIISEYNYALLPSPEAYAEVDKDAPTSMLTLAP